VTNASSFTFTPDDEGSYGVGVTVADNHGLHTTLNQPIVGVNVAPTAAVSGGPSGGVGAQGSPITLTGTASSPSPASNAAPFLFAWSVTQDGAPYTLPSGTVTNAPGFTFTPDDGGTYAISLTVTDEDGITSSPATTTVAVSDAAPSATITGLPSGGTSPEGTTLTLGGTVVDTSASDTLAGFVKTWTLARNGQVFAVAHAAGIVFTPIDPGTYSITFAATNEDD